MRIEQKVRGLKGLAAALGSRRRSGEKVVFTNGCFDILHYGHVRYLQDAKAKGDILVVGVNSDVSVRRNKGRSRPVNPERSRALVIAGLESVDYVVIFREDTPLETIRSLKPDVLVKGSDWKRGEIVGADFVRASGGKVFRIPFKQGFSTTAIIEKIKNC